MNDQYLIRRGKGWAFRIAVPSDLKGQFKSGDGKLLSHIVFGLGTDSLDEARLRRDKMLATWRLNFERARKGLELSVSEIEEQAREIYVSKLEQMAEVVKRGMAPQIDLSHEDEIQTYEQKEINALDIALDEYLRAGDEHDFSIEGRCPVAGDLATVERRAKVALDPNGRTYRLACEAVLQANILALEGRMKMLRGEPSDAPLSFLGSDSIDPISLQRVTRAVSHKARVSAGKGDGLRLSETVSLWIAELRRDPNATLQNSTLWYYEKICSIFCALERDPPLEAVTRKQAADFLNKVGEDRELSNRTLRQYATVLAGLFKWARKAGRFQGENPFAEQSFRSPNNTEYVPFNDDELKTLFSGPLFKKPITDALAWISLISLYSGMRLNEIAQLWAGDIKKEHGIWIFDLQEGEGQRLKTRAATRKVPIHSELIEADLLKYVSRLASDGRVFPALSANSYDHKLDRNLSSQFVRYRRKLNINRDRLCFHSLRKNFGTALDRAGIPPTDREALLGHSRGFSLDVYSTGPGLKRLKNIVEAAAYNL
jgi:integrase